MDLRTVGSWRKDTDQVVSDLAGRLMAWITETHSGSQQSDGVAAAIERGLRLLLDADAVVVLARAESDGGLAMLAATGMPENESNTSNEEQQFAAGELLSIMPHHPFLLQEVGQNLQEIVQDLAV